MSGWGACWERGAETLIVADVAAQDDVMLLAVHQPPQLRRMPVPERGAYEENLARSAESTQEELLDHLLDTLPTEGTLIVPIVGVPGTGKSHLIRWLRHSIQRDDLVVRHVPREGTSLPSVVRILLEGLEGSGVEELRTQMAHAASEISDPRVASLRLASRISEVVRFGPQAGWRRAAAVDKEMREALCHRLGLPALLDDPVTKEHLTREGGAVHRLARDISEGRSHTELGDEDELSFVDEDLQFNDAELRSAGMHARRVVNQLRMAEARSVAIAVLSDALDEAAAAVIGLGTTSLADLIRQLRAELLRDGKELVLLFEDMAIARGLQVELVDALVEPAVREGKQRLCTLRVGLAMPPSYWEEQAPETLSTRVRSWGGELFSLDVPAASAGTMSIGLVGSYLNAARVGHSRLRQLGEAALAKEIPNQCDACPLDVRGECHAAFGATDDGRGLYPLNRSSAVELARLASLGTSSGSGRFRPRAVLSEVVATTLRSGTSIAGGGFPPEELLDMVERAVARGTIPGLSMDAHEAIESAASSEQERRRLTSVLVAWRPDDDARAKILDVLALADPGTSARISERTRTTTPPPTQPDRRVQPETAVQDRDVEAWQSVLNDWVGGTPLSVAFARDLRARIFRELDAGIQWGDLSLDMAPALAMIGISSPQAQLQNVTVRIEDSGGGRAIGTGDPIVTIKRGVRDARLMLAVLRKDKHGGYGYAEGLEDHARIRSMVRAAEHDIRARLERASADRTRSTGAAKTLVLAAAPLGLIDASRPFGEMWLQAMGANDPSPSGAEGNRSHEWKQLLRLARGRLQAAHRYLEGTLGRHQGRGGETTLLDRSQVDEGKLRVDPGGIKHAPPDDPLVGEHSELVGAARAAVAAERRRLEHLLGQIDAAISDDDDVAEAVKRIMRSVNAAARAQMFAGDVDELKLLGRACAQASPGLPETRSAGREILALPDAAVTEALAHMAHLDWDALEAIASFMESAGSAIEASTQITRRQLERLGGGDVTAAGEVRSALSELRTLLEEATA